MRKALFLDRDGVINEEVNYLYKIEDFVFIDEIFAICKTYQQNGFIIVIITNQAGIARGKYTIADFEKLNNWMKTQFSEKGITIEKVYFCPHHPEFTGECNCRKPKPGMIFQAQKEFNIDLSKSILIGDKISDIEAGLNAGIESSYHIEEILSAFPNLPLLDQSK